MDVFNIYELIALKRLCGFFAHLSKLLINDPKLEIVANHVFIEGNNKS